MQPDHSLERTPARDMKREIWGDLPCRREILDLIRSGELSAGGVADHFPDVTRPAISQHLKVLEKAGLVQVRRQGTSRLYRARPEGMQELQRYLEGFWDERLAKLKSVIEANERRPKHDE